MNEEDIFCLGMLEKPDKAEAMQWFKEGKSNGNDVARQPSCQWLRQVSCQDAESA
ncbi:MAG: hypothetical protein KBA53_01700 [Thermoclostridium sp.]|nr:hypothetical protein [Thermoclostridium sp.]